MTFCELCGFCDVLGSSAQAVGDAERPLTCLADASGREPYWTGSGAPATTWRLQRVSVLGNSFRGALGL